MPTTRTLDIQIDETQQQEAQQIQSDVERGLSHLGSKQYDAAIAAFRLAYERTPASSPVRDIVTHNLLTAYRPRIKELLDAGEPLHVNRYLPEVVKLDLTSAMRDDNNFRTGFADLMRSLALDLYNHRQHEPALFFMRRALSLEKCPSYYVDLANTLAWTKQRAQLRDYTTDYNESDLGTHIFLACAPKSGSTFLKNVLQSVTGFRSMFSVYAALQNEQEMDLAHLVKFGNVNTVTQQHARASEPNLQMMQAFGVRPVVLVRNIYDTVASLLDFYTNGYVFSTYFDKEDFLAMDRDEKVDLLIEYVMPWYFQFVSSYQRAERDGRLEMMWLTYEEMVADKAGMVGRILAFYGVTGLERQIAQKIAETESNADQNRFNKGETGRGEMLSSDQKQRIASLGRYFPSADFAILGI